MKQFRIPFLGSIAVFGPEQGFLTFEPELRGRLLKGDKSPAVWGKRELSLGRLARGERAREYALVNGDVLLSNRVITDAGVLYLTQDWVNDANDITNFNYHAHGTGTQAESVNDGSAGTLPSGLQTAVGTRAAGTKSLVGSSGSRGVQSVGTISVSTTSAITEHGLFSASTSGTLWDRSVFSAINVVNGDSIQYTYTCTINSGG